MSFVGVTPVDRIQPEAFGAVIALDLTDDPVGGVLTDVDRDVLDSTLDIGWATQKPDGLLVCRISEVGYPQVRRWARSSLPTMWKMTTAQIHHRRVTYSSVMVLGEKPDGTLWNLSNRYIRRGVARLPASDQEKTNLILAHGLALSAEYCWTVEIGDVFRMALHTDAVGARDLLRDRDLPDGSTRRAALRHWVSAHSRRLRPTPDDPDHRAFVRAHMRGATQTTWGGIRAVVRPSIRDMRKAGL